MEEIEKRALKINYLKAVFDSKGIDYTEEEIEAIVAISYLYKKHKNDPPESKPDCQIWTVHE